MATPFGQVVIGPPGSGKSTYCAAMRDFLTQAGRRVVVVNLDPANEECACDIDVRDLVDAVEVAERMRLGPNGALIFSVEYLAANLGWLHTRLRELDTATATTTTTADPTAGARATSAPTPQAAQAALPPPYVLFDCPGQVELYTHHQAVRSLVDSLERELGFRLCAVHLVDSHHCNDPGKFVSVLLTALSTMLQLELPHINVLSKIDLVESYGKLAFNLDFYTDVLDLSYLVEQIADDPFAARYKSLTAALVELIEGFGLVGFHTLNVQDRDSMTRLTRAVDKASGYIHGDLAAGTDGEFSLLTAAFQSDPEHLSDAFLAQERYMGDDGEPWV